MTRAFYSLLMWLAQPFLRARLRQRGVAEPGYRVAMDERFGRYAGGIAHERVPASVTPASPEHRPPIPLTAAPAPVGYVWIHAVSLGETRAAALLIERLRERQPNMRLLLTHGTATGRAEGARLLRAGDAQVWQPWDTPWAVQRFLMRFRPRIGILMETEVWPNLAAACQRAGVPLVLANARLSEQSQRKAQRLGWLSRPAYGSLAAVWAQTDADAQRLAAVGAKVTGVFGNIKFDATPDAAQLAQGARWRQAWRNATQRPVVMFASSRAGEEAGFLKILESFKAVALVGTTLLATKLGVTQPQANQSGENGIQWLVVPRHPQRVDEVALLIESHGLRFSRRSSWVDGPPMAPGNGAGGVIWLGDSLGEMSLYYGLADVALLGGSFEEFGGQNLIEAAACGCPLIMGPHTFNFADAATEAIACGAARRVGTLGQAVTLANDLVNGQASGPVDGQVDGRVGGRVSDGAGLVAMRAATAGFTAANSGAVEKTVSALLRLMRAR